MESAETPSAPPQAIVFFRDRLVELADVTAPTLGELCDAFGLDFVPGTCVQERATGRVVATLPFEVLPAVPAGAKASGPVSFSPEAGSTEEGDQQEEELDTTQAGEPVLFDLIVPDADGTPNGDQESEDGEKSDLDGVPEALSEAAKRLVKLGAVGLLAEEPDARADANPYVAEDAPGLFKRILYGDEVYCPYREARDPLHTSRALASKVANAHAHEHPYGNSRPYWATPDVYTVPALRDGNGDKASASPFFFGNVITDDYREMLFAGRERAPV